MFRLRIVGLVVAALLFLGSFPASGPAATAADRGRVVMVVIDRLDLNDLGGDAFAGIVAQSGLGLMNTNTGGMRNVENTHATIGAGSRIVATGAGFSAFEAAENFERLAAGGEFERRTGGHAPEGSVVHLGIARIWNLSRELPYPAQVGAIGAALHAEGLVTGVLGNADWAGMPRRPAVTIAMDDRGLVDRGIVGDRILTADPLFPGRLRTDYEALFVAFRDLNDVDFLVIDLGDLSRLDEARQLVLPEPLADLRAATLVRSAGFIDRVRQELDPGRDLLLVVSPTPPAANISGRSTLSPLLMIGPDGSGTITSYATRREGIITNMDIAPTVLQFFGLTPSTAVTGRPLVVLPGTPDLAGLQALNNQVVLTHNVRVPIIKGYMTLQLILVVLGVFTVIIREFNVVRRDYLQALLLVGMSFPLAALLLPLLPQPGALQVVLGIVAMTLAIGTAAIAISRKKKIAGLAFLSGTTALFIVGDLLLGAPLQKFSLLSYDPQGGARFYGIGNEYMGVLIGATILTAAVLLSLASRHRKLILSAVGFLFLLTLFVIANPRLGANMGGTITAVLSFLLTMLLFLGVRFTRRLMLAAGAGVLAFLAGLTALDFMRGVEQQSHIGRSARLVFGGDLATGLQEAYHIVERKVAMNVKLLRHTIWSRLFLASLGGLALLFYRPIGRMQAFKRHYPYLFSGLVGIVMASLVTLVFNDSGVVAAATLMIFGAPPLLYFFLEEVKQ